MARTFESVIDAEAQIGAVPIDDRNLPIYLDLTSTTFSGQAFARPKMGFVVIRQQHNSKIKAGAHRLAFEMTNQVKGR